MRASDYIPTILICDDSIEEIRVIVSILRSANYRIIIASNGKEACDRATVLQPDLILLDVRMPVMDGFAACRILKAHPDTRDIPVIFLSSAIDMDNKLEGLRIGAVDYIGKPANEQEVLLRVGIHIKRPAIESEDDPDRPMPLRAEAVVQAFVDMLDKFDESPADDLDELASKLGQTRQTLSDAFREVFGYTLYHWIREQRMKRACQWISLSTMPINDIAIDLGYSSAANFSTAFRERFGVSPKMFRNLAKQADQPLFAKLLTKHPLDLSPTCHPWSLLNR